MGKVECTTCPRRCRLAEGQVGACRARGNVSGRVACLNYGRATSLALDPVEKKPFSNWMSGRYVLSVGSFGCNLSCPFCQNHTISQAGEHDVAVYELSPEELVSRALDLRSAGCVGVAFTYNEPLVGWEYVKDASKVAHEAGLKTALVSNGAVEPSVFSDLVGIIDAVNFDLKAFNAEFYRACGSGDALHCVRDNIRIAHECPTCHLEVTSLFVAGMSSESDVLDAAYWIAHMDPAIPFHLSQYHPAYRMDTPAVPDRAIRLLGEKLGEVLDTVVLGNLR